MCVCVCVMREGLCGCMFDERGADYDGGGVVDGGGAVVAVVVETVVVLDSYSCLLAVVAVGCGFDWGGGDGGEYDGAVCSSWLQQWLW